MNLKLAPSNRAVALVVAIIFAAAILIIGGTIVYMLVKMCQKVFPPTTPSNTNQTSYVETSVVMVVSNEQTRIDLATNYIPELAIGWRAEVERSTNMIDWQPILQTTVGHTVSVYDDTNPPSPAAFYRMHFYK